MALGTCEGIPSAAAPICDIVVIIPLEHKAKLVRPVGARRPTVLHVTTVDMSLALLLLPQLTAFREAGYDVVGASAPGDHVRTLEDHGIRHEPLLSSTRAQNLLADVSTLKEFVRLCRRLRPDIVHAHNPKPGVYGRIGARVAGVPHVVNTVHGLYAQPGDAWTRRAAVYSLERLAATCSDAELVQNPEDVTVLRRLGISAEKLHVLGNGIDLDRFDPAARGLSRQKVRAQLNIEPEEVVVGLVGRLVAEKGYREVFAAAAELRERQPNIHFLVVGPADTDKTDAISPQELECASNAYGVTFLGMRDDVEDLYLAMDLYVLASHREGFPRSAMEAAAMGLPIVATNIRGCRQVVDDGRTGLLVPVRDPTALARAVEALAVDPDRRREMGQAARTKAVSEFDDRRQIETTLRVYETLLRRQ